eukprot:8795212-Pyramimonas_sp.AAC.1
MRSREHVNEDFHECRMLRFPWVVQWLILELVIPKECPGGPGVSRPITGGCVSACLRVGATWRVEG